MEQTHPPRRTYYLNSRSILSRGQDDYFLLLGFKPVQHSGVSQKRNGTLMNK